MDRALRQFLAIADAGSITAASRALNVTQPTLSVNMQKLEREVGVPLLKRTAEGVRLTPYGESFSNNVRMMQRLYDNTLVSLKEQLERSEEGMSIASGYTWWSLFLRDVVRTFREEHPTAPVRVNLGDQLQGMEQLLAGDVSISISNRIDGLRETAGARFIPLSQSGTGYFVRPGHPLLAQKQSRQQIFAYPMAITSPPENRYRAFIDEAQRLDNVAKAFALTRFAFASNSLHTAVDYVRDSDAVLAHTQLLAGELSDLGLVEVDQSAPSLARTVGVYVLEESESDRQLSAFLDLVLASARDVLPRLID